MAFTVGAFGLALAGEPDCAVGTFYLTSLLFVLVVLGTIARLAGFSILRFLVYIKDELLIVLAPLVGDGAAAHDPEDGAPRRVEAGGRLVIPTGYSFNLDGTNIYMTLGDAVPRAGHQHAAHHRPGARILVIAMITSKGASGVTGAAS